VNEPGVIGLAGSSTNFTKQTEPTIDTYLYRNVQLSVTIKIVTTQRYDEDKTMKISTHGGEFSFDDAPLHRRSVRPRVHERSRSHPL
jgi:hypothetical protein